MAAVTLAGLTKVYPNGTKALDRLDLHVADGEFMVLVGPSGCGKTTALRMVAGLEDITAGEVRFGDTVVNDLTPRQRDVAMVFQNYALYPHMTVAENIGFALRLSKVPKADAARRVRQAAAVLGLERLLEVRPGQLSGGQRQRVAMGRAIVREPAVFLMDEPLSNLDAKLRVQMRAEVARVQRQVGVATLYVTHDQTEAMTMGQRVAVLQGGTLQQCGPPQELYDHPANMFVAAFIGSPAMNLYRAQLDSDGSRLRLGGQLLALNGQASSSSLAAWKGRELVVGVRPENLSVAGAEGPHAQALCGEVDLVESLGSELIVHFSTDAELAGTVGEGQPPPSEAEAGSTGSGSSVARLEPRSPVRPGGQARFLVDPDQLHFFDPASGGRLGSS